MLLLGHVAVQRQHRAQGRERGLGEGQRLAVDVEQRHRPAHAEEPLGDGPADAAGGTGDEGDRRAHRFFSGTGSDGMRFMP